MVDRSLDLGSYLLRQRWLIVVLACVFLAVHVQYTLKLRHSEHGNRSAFLRWRAPLAELDDGVNVWEKYAHPNTPLTTILLKPFLDLPPMLGSSLWFLCKSVLALASILGMLMLLDSAERPIPLWGKMLAVALSIRPIAGDLMHGNVNLLILFLIVAMLIATLNRHGMLAGLLLGFAIACKLTPALFLFYFLWKRAWTTLLGAGVGLFVFVLLPGAVFGWNNNLTYWQSWRHQMVAPYAAGIVSSEHKNQSLPGLLHRMLGAEPSFSEYDGDVKIVLETHNLVSWDRQAVQGMILASMVLFSFAAMGFCRASMRDPPRLELIAEFSVVILGMLLFCERTWKHHCVTLLVPFCVLAYVVSNGSFARGQRWCAGIALGLTCSLMLSTSTAVFDQHLDAHERVGKLAQVYGAYVWAFLVLLASMFIILHHCRLSVGVRELESER